MFPKLVRWIALVPLSLTVAFLAGAAVSWVGGLGQLSALQYAGALLSGVAFVWAGLTAARYVAPSHQRLVLIVLGIFFIGDLTFVTLLMPEEMLNTAPSDGIGILFKLLRAGEYAELAGGGIAKIVGALVGLAGVWVPHVVRAAPESTD